MPLRLKERNISFKFFLDTNFSPSWWEFLEFYSSRHWYTGIQTTRPLANSPQTTRPDLQTTSSSSFYPLPSQTSHWIYEPKTLRYTNYSSFFYPLPNKLFFVLLSTTRSEDRGQVVWGELSRGRVVWHSVYHLGQNTVAVISILWWYKQLYM